MENLEDFRYYFADEEEIDAFVTAIWKPEATTPQEPEEEPEVAPEMKGDCRQLAAQISRVKQAWQATRKLSLRNENLDTVGNIATQKHSLVQPGETARTSSNQSRKIARSCTRTTSAPLSQPKRGKNL